MLDYDCVSKGGGCSFRCLVRESDRKKKTHQLFLCFPPAYFWSSSLHSPLLSTYCWAFSMWVVFTFSTPLSLLSLPLCVAPSVIISVSAAQYCWEASVIIISLLSSSLFLPLLLSLWLPLIHYPSLTTLLCCCEVDPTLGRPSLLTVPLYLSICPPSSFAPSHRLVLATEMYHCEKRPSLSSSIKCMSFSCAFLFSLLSYFSHSCFSSFAVFLSIPRDLFWPSSDCWSHTRGGTVVTHPVQNCSHRFCPPCTHP